MCLCVYAFICLLAKYLVTHRVDFNKTCRKSSLDVHLQMFIFWSHPGSRWLPQQTELKKHKTACESDNVKNNDLDFGAIVTESDR